MKDRIITIKPIFASLALLIFAGSAAIPVQAAGVILYVANGSSVDAYQLDQANSAVSSTLSPLTPAIPWTDAFALTTDTSGDIYVADAGANRIVEFNAAGTQKAVFNIPTDGSGGNINPQEIALDSAGNLYVTSYDGAISEFASSNGARTTIETIPQDRGIVTDPINSKTYVSTSGLGDVTLDSFTTGVGGAVSTVYTTGDYPDGQLRGVTFDNANNVYLADSTWNAGQGYIEKITSAGVATTFITGLDGPNSLAINGSSGTDLYVADYFAGDVEEFALSDGHLENTIVSGLGNVSGIALSGGRLNGGAEPEFFAALADDADAPEPASGSLLALAFALLLVFKPLRKRFVSARR
jgi:sugar lactone lactonase YvrE